LATEAVWRLDQRFTVYSDAGRVRVFASAELVSTEAPTMKPTAAPSVAMVEPTVELSFGLVLAPTDGPTAGSQTFVSTLDTITGTPTGAPSVYTSLIHVPSSRPTISASPSVANTAAPSSPLGKTDWDIDCIGDITVNFAEEATAEEIKIIFNIHRRDTTVRVFKKTVGLLLMSLLLGLRRRVPQSRKQKIRSKCSSISSRTLFRRAQSFLRLIQKLARLASVSAIIYFRRLPCRQFYSTTSRSLLLLT
jgi:hypothetical protein